jgi:hypothetical protein
METHGFVIRRLEAAIGAARRLRGHPVHPATLRDWRTLLHEARNELHVTSDDHVGALVSTLECEMLELSPW